MNKHIIQHGASYIRNDGDTKRVVDECPECGLSIVDIHIEQNEHNKVIINRVIYTCNTCKCKWVNVNGYMKEKNEKN